MSKANVAFDALFCPIHESTNQGVKLEMNNKDIAGFVMQFRLNNDLLGIYYILFISSEKTGRTVALTMIFVICLIWVAVHHCRCDGLYLVKRGILHIKNVINNMAL